MTATKKTNTKSSKSLTPATKTSKKSAKPAAAKKKTVVAVAKRAPAAPVAAKAKPVKSAPVTTTVTAKIDVGFGNAVYIRGSGPGLSWDQGVLMDCSGVDVWSITLGESARPFTIKFLVNDLTWSVGPDFVVESGQTVTFSPGF